MTDRLPGRRGTIHRLFQGGIALKGLMGLTEAVAGTLLLTTSPQGLHEAVSRAGRIGLIARSDHPVFGRMLRAAESLPAGSQHFYAIYLLFHGVMKLVMVSLLWARVSWAYPAAIVIQCAFVLFEGHRWWETGNPVLLALALIDLAIIWLIWNEWSTRSRSGGSGGS